MPSFFVCFLSERGRGKQIKNPVHALSEAYGGEIHFMATHRIAEHVLTGPHIPAQQVIKQFIESFAKHRKIPKVFSLKLSIFNVNSSLEKIN